jgi:hypothetical protein
MHAVDADEQYVLDLAVDLCGGRSRKQAKPCTSNEREGEKATFEHFEPPGYNVEVKYSPSSDITG